MKKEKSIKVIAVLTITFALIAFIAGFFSYILPFYLSYKSNMYINNVDSVDVIGGADGPTAIFISSQFPFHLLTAIFGLLTIIGIMYVVITKYKEKHN
jgi:Na+-transporting methylmalonyl-CoA/oxaloacetate decarboxylase beta subunit